MCGVIDDPFIRDQSVTFYSLYQSYALRGLVLFKEIGSDNVHVSALVLWVIQFFQDVVFHGLVIQCLQPC